MKRIVILASEGITTNYLYNSLKGHCSVELVLIEKKEKALGFFKRKVKLHGLIHAIDQMLFLLVIRTFQRSRKRIEEIQREFDLSSREIHNSFIKHVDSLNDRLALERIAEYEPDYVIINGTGILKKRTLEGIKAPILNIHVGITPQYRGVHGGYWALAMGDREKFGVTLHFVDKGVDTGAQISQRSIPPSGTDNFSTYPILQYANGIDLLLRYLDHKVENIVQAGPIASDQWYHPGISTYLKNRILKGVK